MKKPPKVDFRKLLAPRNRGILLDIVVFFVNLILMNILTRLSRDLVDLSEHDVLAKAAIGVYFAGLFFLQPLGPVFKRWSFHQQHKFDSESLTGCLLLGLMFFYLIMMLLISSAAIIILTEVLFEQGSPESQIGPVLILVGLAWSIVNVVLIYRYFVRPKKPPRWSFLTTPVAAILGDIFMFVNMISLQVLWNSLTAATSFWSNLTSTPLGRPGSFTDILGRFIVIGTLALLVYFPGRMYYLVEDRRRKIIWLTMLLANLPLLLRAVFAPPT
jgi:hypothetical protein